MFTLQEQYLYGSKRLGVGRPKLQLPTAPHLLEMCAHELLQVPLLPVKRANCFRCRESETIQKRTECLAFQQRLTAAGCAKSKIQFGNQKSEINQVLDRKTGVKASPTATTYAWFKADVTTAQDHYPFGSLMPSRTYVAGNVNVGTNSANWNTGVGDGRSLGQLAEARARSVSQVLISDIKVNPTQVRFGRGNIVNGRQGQSTTFRINTGGTGQ